MITAILIAQVLGFVIGCGLALAAFFYIAYKLSR